MKRKLIFIMVVALTTWGIQAALNPHITELDLNIDGVADYDEFYEPSPSTTPKGPGGFVCSNGWKKITLKAVGVNEPMKTRLNWDSSKIEVWTATNGGTQVLSPTNYSPASSMPTQLWVKGVSVSATGPTKDASGNWTNCGPETLCLEAVNNGANPTTPGTYYDRVAFTVVSVTFQAGTGTNTQAITNVTTLVDKDAMIEAVVSPASLGGSITYSITDTAKATVSPPTGATSPQALTVHGVSTSSVPTTLNAMVAGSVCGSLPVTVDEARWILSHWGPASVSGSKSPSRMGALSIASASALTTPAAGETDIDTGTMIAIPDNEQHHFRYRARGNWFLSLLGFTKTVTWVGAAEESNDAGFSIATNTWATPGPYVVTVTQTSKALWFFTLSETSESVTVHVIHIEFAGDDTIAWTASGAYNAKNNLMSASFNTNSVSWSIMTVTGATAAIYSGNGAVTLGSGGGEYSITATSADLASETDTMTLIVPKVDIEMVETNVCCTMTSAALNLTTASYDGGGGVTWTSSPAGLSVVGYTASTFTFNPSNSTPTSYVVTAWANALTNCMDTATVNVYRVELTPKATNVCWQTSAPVEIVLTNSYAPGGITWSGTNGLKVVSATDAKLVFTPTNSTPTNYAVKAASTGSPNCYDVCTVNVYRVELTPKATNVCWQTTAPVEIVLTNSYAPGGITWSGTNGLKVVSATEAKLVFTPTNSTPTNYAVKAASTGSPNCYDVCTVNVYRVELTPRTTNVWWQTSIPVEIVLTNSYAPGGITWSGTNGLKVVSATDAKLVFTPTNSTPTNYAVKATATAFTNCYDICAVSVMKVELDGLRVYDPKLENAGNSEIKYKIYGPASGFMPRLELTVMDGATEVACIVRKTDASPVIGAGITTNWDGKWGTTKAGTNTVHKGKLADPKQYKMELMVYESAAATTATWTNKFDLYVVRLGINAIGFDGVNANEWIPLTYHATIPAHTNDGLSDVAERYAIPQETGALASLLWRLGKETNNNLNVDFTFGPNAGHARSEETPWTGIFMPPQDIGTSGAQEDDSFNYPVCYKAESKVKMAIRTSAGAWSQVQTNEIPASALGYDIPVHPVSLNVTWNGSELEPVAAGGNEDIAPDSVVIMQSTNTLPSAVGLTTETFSYTWTYRHNGATNSIPGSFTTSHRIYRVVDVPKLPWNISNPTTRPWVAALDYAVNWATAANDAESVATKITEQINSGGLGLKYDSPGGGGTEGGAHNYGDYANGTPLRLANFLLFINGGAVENRLRTWSAAAGRALSPADIVNCTDCGTLTVAFSSILGSPLVLTQLNSAHSCNEIKAIGREGDGWQKPFVRPDGSGGFGYHAFAGMNNNIWDACLKVEVGDPTVGGVRTGEAIPLGMVRTLANPASATAPAPFGPIAANGTVVITKVYDQANHRGVVPDAVSFRCTAVAGGQATFRVDCGRNGSTNIYIPNVPLTGQNSGTVSTNGVNIIDFTITQGTVLFTVGNEFICKLKYDFSEYRSALAAPDWDKMDGVDPGRTPATTFTPYTSMEVE